MRRPLCMLLLVALVTIVAPGCTQRSASMALRRADEDWAKAAATKNLEGMMAYYAPNARLLPPNEPMAAGAEAIRSALRPLFAAPGFALAWQATHVEVAKSGEIGYVQGTYTLTTNDDKGKPKTDRGKFLEVWKKQPDGTWKCLVDMFSSDLPPG